MPTEKYPGVLVFFFVSSLSPSQLNRLKMTEPLIIIGHVSKHESLCRDRETSLFSGSCRKGSAAYHPMYRLRVKMAAMGSVEESVDANSTFSLFPAGS
jgi:hypothetical protein